MTNLEHISNEHTEQLEENSFLVHKGWNTSLANDIVEASKQTHVVESTPNDSLQRFRDLGSAIIWHEQGRRSVYSLRGDGLAGIIWYDVRLRPDLQANYTFAIRMYREAVGRKLAHAFMTAAHTDFAHEKKNPSVWLETDESNIAAIRLYDKFGYELAAEDGARLTMVYRPENRIN
jgi:ribosomal protein S18 acetylase RimI-like enzyme